jgi:hypothetical protein
MHKQARDKRGWTLDSDEKKAPGSSVEVRGSRGRRRQTEQETYLHNRKPLKREREALMERRRERLETTK